MSGPTYGGHFSSYPQGFTNGLLLRGIPLVQAQPGQVFFVGNGTQLLPGQNGPSNGNKGTFLSPFATLDYAISVCMQGRGDIVFVLPGHYETISDAVTLSADCAGVAVIGLGGGGLRPIFVLDTATTANIPVRAANMSFQNITFMANFLDIASMFTGISASVTAAVVAGTAPSSVAGVGGVMSVTVVGSGTVYPGASVSGTGVPAGTYIISQLSGTTGGVGTYQLNRSFTFASGTIVTGCRGLTLDNCVFRDTSSVLNALTIYTASGSANASDGFNFTRNFVYSAGTTAATTAIKFSTAQDTVTISDNVGNWAVLNNTAAMLATGANSVTNFTFDRNQINRPNTSTTSGLAISTSATAWTGQCNDNRIWGLNNSAQIWIDTGTKLAFNQNYCPITAAADKSGLINPAAV